MVFCTFNIVFYIKTNITLVYTVQWPQHIGFQYNMYACLFLKGLAGALLLGIFIHINDLVMSIIKTKYHIDSN